MARVGAAALSGLLLALSRPRFDFGPLACIALVPLFLAWRDRGARASAGLAFVSGVVYYAIVCSWIWYFGTVAIVPFIAAVAGYWAAAGAVVGWLRRSRVSSPWLTAAVWVCADTAVARWPLGGLSWGEIGYAFHDVTPARAVASVGGVTFVTFLAVAFNAWIAQLIAGPWSPGRLARAYASITVIAVIVVATTLTRFDPRPVGSLRIALVQGNDKNRDLTQAELDERYLPATHFALAERITDPVDLIVFPESSMDADPRSDPYIHDNLVRIARRHHAWVLANSSQVDATPDAKKALNLDVLFSPAGDVVGTYAKRHLVPFGEYVPFRSELEGWIPALEQVPRDFQRGPGPARFDVAGVRIAPVICFESAFGYQIRPQVRDGADVIVVSTNNRSYRRSANSAQHLAIGQMRAAETGRPLIQSAISGITAVVGADGSVHERTGLFQNSVTETTLVATTGETLYVRYGEWVAIAAGLMVVGAVVVALVRLRRKASIDLRTPQEIVSIESRIAGYDVPGHRAAEPEEITEQASIE